MKRQSLVIAALTVAVAGCGGRVATGEPEAAPSSTQTPGPAAAPSQAAATAQPSVATRPPATLPPTPIPPPVPTPTPPELIGSFETPVPTWDPSGPPVDPDLLAMLPAKVSGFPLQRFVLPARVMQGGGDMCFIVCPDEPRQHAEAFGIDLDRLILGVAYPDSTSGQPAGPQVVIVAWRAPGLTPKELIAARVKLHERTGSPGVLVQHLKVAGKPVTRLYESFLQAWYLYAHGDVLFVLIGDDHQPQDLSAWTEHEPVPKDVEAAIRLLP